MQKSKVKNLKNPKNLKKQQKKLLRSQHLRSKLKKPNHRNLSKNKANLKRIISQRPIMTMMNNKKLIRRKIFYLDKSIKHQIKMMGPELFIQVSTHRIQILKWLKNIVFNMVYFKKMTQFEFKSNLQRKNDYM
jgi:hypothetical protein